MLIYYCNDHMTAKGAQIMRNHCRKETSQSQKVHKFCDISLFLDMYLRLTEHI